MSGFFDWLTQPSQIARGPDGLALTDIPQNEWNAVAAEWDSETQQFVIGPATDAASSAGAAIGEAFTSAAQSTANAVVPAATNVLVWGGAALVGFLVFQRLERR